METTRALLELESTEQGCYCSSGEDGGARWLTMHTLKDLTAHLARIKLVGDCRGIVQAETKRYSTIRSPFRDASGSLWLRPRDYQPVNAFRRASVCPASNRLGREGEGRHLRFRNPGSGNWQGDFAWGGVLPMMSPQKAPAEVLLESARLFNGACGVLLLRGIELINLPMEAGREHI